MKNIKFSILLTTAIGLSLASLGWLGNWGYKKFFTTPAEYNEQLIVLKPVDSISSKPEPIQKDKVSITNEPAKSISTQKISQDKPNPSAIPSTSTLSEATAIEISKLKTEIEKLSKEKNNNADDKIASQKITELEQKVNKLTDKNSSVETENKRLFAVLKKLSDDKKEAEQKSKAWPVVYDNKRSEIKTGATLTHAKSASANKSTNPPTTPELVKKEIAIPVKTNTAGENSFAVETLQLSAYTVTDNKEIETSQAYQTDKFVGSVMVKNSNFQNNSGEIIIVILQPDGRVLQKSTWETGTFQSSEGKKVYSCKMRFDYAKGETKKLSFFINAASFLKGNYLMQIYCKGILIGKMIKTLS